jgi:hypothetical protein
MAYKTGDRLRCTSRAAELFNPGDVVEVTGIHDDGVPQVEILPTEDQPVGRGMRLVPELEDNFEPA